MIQYKKGNLLDVKEGHIIHGCNAQAVMGGGVAYLIRKKYPGCYTAYANEYMKNGLKLGTSVQYSASPMLCIWNAITQEFFGRDPSVVYVDYNAIKQCFEGIEAYIAIYDTLGQFTPDVHIPLIGAGLGNGDWYRIESIINAAMPARNITVWLIDGIMPNGIIL